MGIEVQPSGRASKFHDLATLKITHSKGIFETPNRIVTKNDWSAKDNLGADISLTRSSKAFIIQENINPDRLQSILKVNGYMENILSSTRPWKNKIGDQESLIFFYPSLTDDATKSLIELKYKQDFIRFSMDVANQMGLESVILPAIIDVKEMNEMAKQRKLQLIPVLDLKNDILVFENQFKQCKVVGESDIPIIAFKFAPYPKANLAYNMIMDELDKLHEKHQATMLVNLQRNLKGAGNMNVSSPHYGSLIMGDIMAETHHQGGGDSSKPKGPVSLFCKKDLVALHHDEENQLGQKFELEEEKKVFSGDKGLQDLLERIVNNSVTKKDWSGNRPSYLSRVHENVRTRNEFSTFKKSIDTDTAQDYLQEKKDMNKVMTSHLKDRLKKK